MNYFEKFMEVLDALEKERVEYILIGGFAVILYGLPRVTQDIDIFLKPTGGNISGLKKALKSVFNDRSIDDITLEMLGQYPVVRYGAPDGFSIDIIISLGDAFVYEDLGYETKDVSGHSIRIATIESLYEMKKDTVRPIDKSDSIFLYNLIKGTKKDA